MQWYIQLSKLEKRVVLGKIMGIVLAVLGILAMVLMDVSMTTYFAWGIIFWYGFLGAFIGLLGIISEHPIIRCWKKLHPLGGLFIGAAMNFVLFLLAHEAMQEIFVQLCPAFASTSWLLVGAVVEGALVAFVIDYVLTKKFGTGKQLLGEE